MTGLSVRGRIEPTLSRPWASPNYPSLNYPSQTYRHCPVQPLAEVSVPRSYAPAYAYAYAYAPAYAYDPTDPTDPTDPPAYARSYAPTPPTPAPCHTGSLPPSSVHDTADRLIRGGRLSRHAPDAWLGFAGTAAAPLAGLTAR